MAEYFNPFEFEAATNLPEDMILEIYIEDYNYTRFIQSTRNIFLLGDRGSGKSMTLLYNSFKIKKMKAEREKNKAALDYIGIYIPCNTPLTHKQEYQLLSPFQASIISEHYLVLSMIYCIADSLASMPELLTEQLNKELKSSYEYILNIELPEQENFLETIKLFAQGELTRAQKKINNSDSELFYENTYTFSSIVLPLLNLLSKIPNLKNSHFLLMIDDAHELNFHQKRILNSWIAFRDHTLFSLKVASAKVTDIDFLTASGGSILEGHDFIVIDMEGDFQSQFSRFGKLANEIVRKRLSRIGVNKTPDQFFPINSEFVKDLEQHKIEAEKEALEKNPNATQKQITDYVYKFARAKYFRERSSKANRPPYSGFDTIVHLSTGVVRNLLEPCYWMYDYMYSQNETSESQNKQISEIPSNIQTEVILQLSEARWNLLKNGLENIIENCSREQAKQIENLFENLAILFRERLLSHKSEPRAIVFTISGLNQEYESILKPLFDIARKAQLLYFRVGVAKHYGKQERYYVPNRMLWPIRGLDPHGQHARVSLKAIDILNAIKGKKFPFDAVEDSKTFQESMFNE